MKLVKDWWVPDHMNSAGSHLGRSAVIDVALAYLPAERRRTCIQAGAHIGIWPKLLSAQFEQVYAWEPMQENWDCLIRNLEGVENVLLKNGCLGDTKGKAKMRYSPRNTGKHCIAPDGTHKTSVERLDDFWVPNLDALFLDVEGYELRVLLGAHALIHNNLPLLVIEENGLNSRYNISDEAVPAYLKGFNYYPAEHHGEDVIYAQEGWK